MRRMRDLLKDRLERSSNPRGVHIYRPQIEAWAEEQDIAPEDVTRLFEDLKGVAWFGDYLKADRFGWSGAWITEVR